MLHMVWKKNTVTDHLLEVLMFYPEGIKCKHNRVSNREDKNVSLGDSANRNILDEPD